MLLRRGFVFSRSSSPFRFGSKRRFYSDQNPCYSNITRSCLCGEINESYVDKQIDLWGWVDSVRPAGNQLLFTTLKDYSGSVQLLFEESNIQKIENITDESVIWVRGKTRERPKDAQKLDQGTSGKYEVRK